MRKWTLIEVASIFILVMLAIWVFQQRPLPFAMTITVLVGIIIASFIARVRKIRNGVESCTPSGKKILIAERVADYTEQLGIGRWWKNTTRGWEITYLDFSWAGRLAIGTLISLALIVVAGHFFKPDFWSAENFWDKVYAKLSWYCFLSGPGQQLLLHSFVTSQLYALFTKGSGNLQVDRRAALITSIIIGVMFFIVHIPNPKLMIVTPIAGAATAYIFLNCRNIFILGIAHGILGTALTYCLPLSMRIGPHYWQ